MADIPTEGSGLGSSSTVTVGALHAMHSYLGQLVSAEQLAQEACEIEIDILGKPIGVQDQFIVSYGGLRFIEFTTEGKVHAQKIAIDKDTLRLLNANTMLFYTGFTRTAGSILEEQKQNIGQRLTVLREMKQIAQTARNELLGGNLDAIGYLLHESWLLKKQLASQISNTVLDDLMGAALKAGALGGKITGAGGGGFLLLYCPYVKQAAVRKALGKLQELPFSLEPDGTKVIFNYQR
jgi:D-glycero-alpha-D-manno-heptose-7-phosphate kinase